MNFISQNFSLIVCFTLEQWFVFPVVLPDVLYAQSQLSISENFIRFFMFTSVLTLHSEHVILTHGTDEHCEKNCVNT